MASKQTSPCVSKILQQTVLLCLGIAWFLRFANDQLFFPFAGEYVVLAFVLVCYLTSQFHGEAVNRSDDLYCARCVTFLAILWLDSSLMVAYYCLVMGTIVQAILLGARAWTFMGENETLNRKKVDDDECPELSSIRVQDDETLKMFRGVEEGILKERRLKRQVIQREALILSKVDPKEQVAVV